MNLTRKDLEKVQFRSRGRWYDAGQVDAFLDELSVAVEESERGMAEMTERIRVLTRQVEKLQSANREIWKEAEGLKKALSPNPREPENGLRESKALEQERDRLIEDIKALLKFRESFRKAVQRDAEILSEKANSLDSEKLL